MYIEFVFEGKVAIRPIAVSSGRAKRSKADSVEAIGGEAAAAEIAVASQDAQRGRQPAPPECCRWAGGRAGRWRAASRSRLRGRVPGGKDRQGGRVEPAGGSKASRSGACLLYVCKGGRHAG